jgi:hypothetical protein
MDVLETGRGDVNGIHLVNEKTSALGELIEYSSRIKSEDLLSF